MEGLASDSAPHTPTPSTMDSSTVNWPNMFSGDLDDPSHILTLKMKVASAQVTLSGAGLEHHLHITLAQLQWPESSMEETHGEVNCSLKESLRAGFWGWNPLWSL